MKVFDYLVVAVAVAAALVIYHVKIVRPLERETKACIKQVYVIDLDGMVGNARKQAIEAAMKGQDVSARQVADEVRRRLALVLQNLPKGCLVLDRSAVIKGGQAIDSKADKKR